MSTDNLPQPGGSESITRPSSPPALTGFPGAPRYFTSLLFQEEPTPLDVAEREADRSFLWDLNLDQIVASIAHGRNEPQVLTTILERHLHDVEAVQYRQEIFRDAEDPPLFAQLRHFAQLMGQVSAHLSQAKKMHYPHQRNGWLLDATDIYCEAVTGLADDLASAKICSRGLLAFREYLTMYVGSAEFTALTSHTRARKEAFAQIRYCTRIRGHRVEVTRYDEEADYSAEVLTTFDRFKQGAVRDYRVSYRTWPGMNHVTAQILELVARLFPKEFSSLEEYCVRHHDFLDPTVERFERELQFYLAYLEYIAPLRSAGLGFCYPEVSSSSKEVFATNTFDLALANKLVSEHKPVVVNDFRLQGPECVFVVTGPNQGGKTTFARTFGQLHHLACVGCPVPGSAARLFLFDHLFTHFEREEELMRMSGKLEDDLVRAGEMLRAATSKSILVLNEIFTSTALHDARFLGTKLLEKVSQLEALCVYVTFVDELASLGESVVSMMSTIVRDSPAERTYKVVRKPADGLAYALSIAEKHGLTYERLRERVVS